MFRDICGFDDVIGAIVVDYTCGGVDFWRWRYRACLRDIFNRLRSGETYASYYNRTGVSDSALWSLTQEGDEESLSNSNEIDNTFSCDDGRDNVLLVELYWFFYDYDYDYAVGTNVSRLIYEYVGWLYGWKSDLQTTEQPSFLHSLATLNQSLSLYQQTPLLPHRLPQPQPPSTCRIELMPS